MRYINVPKRRIKTKLTKVHDKYNDAYTIYKKRKQEFIEECVDVYKDAPVRDNLIKSGKKLCYSESKLSEIKNHFAHWNIDEVDENVANDVYDLEQFVKEREHLSFIDRFVNMVSEEETDNGN